MNITLEKLNFVLPWLGTKLREKLKLIRKKGQHFLVFRLLFDRKIPVNHEKYSNFT